MKLCPLTASIILAIITLACSGSGPNPENHTHYLSPSRFTDPGNQASMLAALPEDVMGICEIAERQSVHHNLLVYHGVPYGNRAEMINVWPPRLNEVLSALEGAEPHVLSMDRQVENRFVGGCMNESHFLAGLLRYKYIPARMRAGYFKDVIGNEAHFLDFWVTNLRGRGIMSDLLEEDPQEWEESIVASLKRQIGADKHFEHWICEYWDDDVKGWRMLDANTTFLKASFDVEVGYHLSDRHFEYAYEAWKRMRGDANFNPDQYREDEQDGPSHIRAQLLWDFYSLLNHDLAGYGEPTRDAFEFIKERSYSDVSDEELSELDALAVLLSKDPIRDELVSFYLRSKTLKLEAAEKDPYSFVYGDWLDDKGAHRNAPSAQGT